MGVVKLRALSSSWNERCVSEDCRKVSRNPRAMEGVRLERQSWREAVSWCERVSVSELAELAESERVEHLSSSFSSRG